MPNTSTTIEGAWTYPKACAVISELRLIGAEAGITAGVFGYISTLKVKVFQL